MTSDSPRVTTRLDETSIKKLKYIARKNYRSLNNEICMVLVKYIESYEQKNGKIDLSGDDVNLL